MLFIAVVALLVLLAVAAAIAVVDLRSLLGKGQVLFSSRSDGFKNQEREGWLGGGRGASPPRRWEDLDVAPLCLVVVPQLVFVVAAVVRLVLVVGFVAPCIGSFSARFSLT